MKSLQIRKKKMNGNVKKNYKWPKKQQAFTFKCQKKQDFFHLLNLQ